MIYLKILIADLYMIVTTLILFVPVFLVGLVDLRRKTQYGNLVIKYWCRYLYGIYRIQVEVEGLQHLRRDRSYVIVSNHRSHLDGPAIIIALPILFGFLVKRSLTQIPLWGWFIRIAGYIPIDRGRGGSARRSLTEAARRVSSGRSVLVFPEGTRGLGPELLPFKKGGIKLAREAGVDVLPVTVVGSEALLPRSSWMVQAGRLRVVVHPPMSPQGELGERIEALRQTICSVPFTFEASAMSAHGEGVATPVV